MNVDRRHAVHDVLVETEKRKKVDFSLVAEPNKTRAGKSRWYPDKRRDAAIIRVNRKVEVLEWGRGEGFVWVQTRDLRLFS